jgi:hypothetical protein
MPLDHRQRQPRRHQRLETRASRCHFIFLMLTSCWLLSSSVVQAVLTEEDIIDKELTWVAMARKLHHHGVYAGAPNTMGSSKTRSNAVNDDNFDWTRDNYDWTQQQREQDRIQLQLQQEEQPQERQQLRSRANLRGRSPLS